MRLNLYISKNDQRAVRELAARLKKENSSLSAFFMECVKERLGTPTLQSELRDLKQRVEELEAAGDREGYGEERSGGRLARRRGPVSQNAGPANSNRTKYPKGARVA
jgi:hypothetical protein